MTGPTPHAFRLSCGLGALGVVATCLWQAPKPTGEPPLRLLLSGFMDGHLEPCGCASAQAGGLDRRAFWLRANRQRYDLKIETGNLVAGNDALQKNKLLWIFQILGDECEYPVFPLGPQDLELGLEELGNWQGAYKLLATDLFRPSSSRQSAPGSTDQPIFERSYVLEAGKHKVLLLSLAGTVTEESPDKKALRIIEAPLAVQRALDAAGERGKAYDLVVCLLHSKEAESAAKLAKSIGGVDLFVTVGRNQEFTRDRASEAIPAASGKSRAYLLRPGWRGKSLLLWEGRKLDDGSWEQVSVRGNILHAPRELGPNGVPKFADRTVHAMLVEHRREVGNSDILEQLAERRPTQTGAKYIGNAACGKCHAESLAVWKESRHAHAWASLVEREKIEKWPTTRHPDCASCHTAGYGEKSGFVSFGKTPELVAVGCESCHGPGSLHRKAFRGIHTRKKLGQEPSKTELAKAIADGKLVDAGVRRCVTCHDFDQSPGFDFNERWEKIEHR